MTPGKSRAVTKPVCRSYRKRIVAWDFDLTFLLDKKCIEVAFLLQSSTEFTHVCFNFAAHVKFEVAQPIRCHLRAFLLLTRYVTLWPWTLTPWPRHSQTMYQIWTQSSKPRQSCCDLNIWPYDLEHLSRVALCPGCTKFELSQAICSWNVTVFRC